MGQVVHIHTEPKLLRRRLWLDHETSTLYIIEWWRERGLTTKVIRRA